MHGQQNVKINSLLSRWCYAMMNHCIYVYVPDDSLVGVEKHRRDINDKLFFFTDGAVCWIKYRMVTILHGMWIALDWDKYTEMHGQQNVKTGYII